MKDEARTKEDLIEEVTALRLRISELEEKTLKNTPEEDRSVTVETDSSAICEGDKIVGIEGRSRDLTKRRLAEEAIKINEERFRKMVQQSTDAISLFSPEGTFLFISDAVYRVLGHRPEELIGQSWESFVHPDDIAMMATKWFQVLEKPGNIVGAEMRGRNKDGSWRWMEVVGSNQIDEPGIGGVIINFRDISERKLAEQSIKEGEHKFKELFENMSSCMAVYETVGDGEDFIFKDFNKAAEKVEQIDQNDLIGKSVSEIFPGVRDMGLFDVFQRVWRTGKSEYHPATLYRDGRIEGWKENYVYKLLSGEIVAVYDDVTEHKRVEEAITKNEERFRKMVQHSTDAISLLSPEGTFVYISDAVERIIGYRPEEMIGQNWVSFVHPDDLSMLSTKWAYLFEKAENIETAECRVQHKDGSWRWIGIVGSNQVNEPGIEAIILNFRDITEHRQAELAIKESEERFRSLFDRSIECIYSHDLEGNFLDANQNTLDLLGYDREDIPSMNFASLLPQEQFPQALQQLEEIVEGGLQREIMEYKIRRKDGEYLDFEIRSSLVYHDGTPYAVMGVARDITERKQGVARLRKAMGATVQAMAIVVETRDPYTAGHQRRVADLARSIASEMGLPKNTIEGIRTASAIHDIGKISIPTEILSKPTRLSDTEFSLIKIHPQAGYDILKDIEFPWPVARMVLEHHERMDGLGYPNGLEGENILLESRIIALADVVEAIASHRPYRPSLGIDMALEEIVKNRGTQFDPEAVDACLRLFKEKKYRFLDE